MLKIADVHVRSRGRLLILPGTCCVVWCQRFCNYLILYKFARQVRFFMIFLNQKHTLDTLKWTFKCVVSGLVNALLPPHESVSLQMDVTCWSLQCYCFHSHTAEHNIFPELLLGVDVGNCWNRFPRISIPAPIMLCVWERGKLRATNNCYLTATWQQDAAVGGSLSTEGLRFKLCRSALIHPAEVPLSNTLTGDQLQGSWSVSLSGLWPSWGGSRMKSTKVSTEINKG